MKRRRNKSKLAAFTIIELIVVMLLTTVIATLSYLAINNTQQQYQSYEKSNDVGLEIAALNTLLKNDFHKAKDIQLINGAIVFQMTDYRVVYQFEEKKVKRTNQTKTDTLDVIVLDKQITFKNEPIQKGRIDQLQLECKYFEDKTTLMYTKSYSSKDLWKYEN
jgi:type II secretory pathway pseudopilin PulG